MEAEKISKISRRSLLKASTGALAIPGLAFPGTVQADVKEQLATLIDLSRCNGCVDLAKPSCVTVCKEINKNTIPAIADPIPVPWPRKTVEDWSRKREVSNRLTPYNFIYVHKADIVWKGKPQTIYVPRRCMHCDNPACATICPFSANHKQRNGAVVIDQDFCFGGAKCRTVCPWEIPQRQSGVGIYLHVLPALMGNGVMYKCDLCNQRLKEGKPPGCVEACPREAMIIGPRKEIYAVAEERIKAMDGYIYGKEENGGTATLYVSPVPFELINETMKKKPGQPDMKPGVERRMAGTDPAGKQALIAPVLGIAAGAAAGFNWLSRRKQKVQEEEKDNG